MVNFFPSYEAVLALGFGDFCSPGYEGPRSPKRRMLYSLATMRRRI